MSKSIHIAIFDQPDACVEDLSTKRAITIVVKESERDRVDTKLIFPTDLSADTGYRYSSRFKLLRRKETICA